MAVNRLICVVAIVVCAGCSRIPEGATFEEVRKPFPRFFLSDQKLSLPWVSLAQSGLNLWCFSNLSFSDSKADVRLEINSEMPFDPRRVGGAASLKIYNKTGDAGFLVTGPLLDQGGSGSHPQWASQYVHDSHGAGQARSVRYHREPDIDVAIESHGDYCVSLDIASPSTIAGDPHARVILSSLAK